MRKWFIGAAAGTVMTASGGAIAGDLDKVEYLGPINKHEFYGEYAEIQGKEYNPNAPRDFAAQFRINVKDKSAPFSMTCDYVVNFPEENEKTILSEAAKKGLDVNDPKMKQKAYNIVQMAVSDCTPSW